MKMKRFNYFLAILAIMVFTGCKKEAPFQKPNILFILVDDLGWADLAYTGSQFYETPNIDKLALQGMVFTDAYATAPVCSPSRAAVMSGKYPARLNLTDYIPGNRAYGPHKNQKLASMPFQLFLDTSKVTVAEALKAEGYKTFLAGKWHLGEEEAFFPDKQGFDINLGGNGKGHPKSYFSPYQNPQLENGFNGEYLTDRLTYETIKFISGEKEKPFFAFLSFYTVHLPLQAKPEKVKKYHAKLDSMDYPEEGGFCKHGKTWGKNRQDNPEYAAMVESLDDNIGLLMEALNENGLAGNTVVIFTSDNGGMSIAGNPEIIPTSNAPLRAGKGYLYEGGIREPLIIRWDGKIKAGTECNTAVTGTDFFPTILDLAGIKHPKKYSDGISILPLLQGKSIDERPIFWHFPHYSGGLGGKPSGAVRLGNYKLIEFYEDMHVELYNLKKDLSETNDLSSALPEKTEELKNLLHQWRDEMDAQMPVPNPYYEKQIKTLYD